MVFDRQRLLGANLVEALNQSLTVSASTKRHKHFLDGRNSLVETLFICCLFHYLFNFVCELLRTQFPFNKVPLKTC